MKILRNFCGKGLSKPVVALIILIFSINSIEAQTNSNKKVKWLKFTEAVEASKKEPRKIFIDIYADWCGWCKVMDRNTFTDTAIVKILNEQYYPVKIDADSKEKLTYKEYNLTYAELAVGLGAEPGSNLGLPTVVLLNEEQDLLTRLSGYQKPDFLKPALLFFSENHYKSKEWDTYYKEFIDKQKHK